MSFASLYSLVVPKKVLRQTTLVATGSLVNGACLFLVNLVMARSLEQSVFGIFSLSVLVLTTMGELSDFGLNTGLLRFASYFISSNQIENLKQLVKTVWNWRVVISVILTCIGVIFAYPIAKYIFGQSEIFKYFAFASFGIGGVIMLGFLATFLQAKQLFTYNAAIQSLKGLLRLGAVALLAFFHVKNLYYYLAVYIAVPWFLYFTNTLVLPENFRKAQIDTETRNKLNKQLANFSFWLTIASLTSIVAGKIDQVMVSHYVGLDEVAIYAVAWQFIQVLMVLGNSISSVLVPRIGGVRNKEELLNLIKRVMIWLLCCVVLLAILIYPSQYLITFFFGANYAASTPIYLVLAYGTLAYIIIIPFSLSITVYNKTYIAALAGVFQLILNVVLNLLLIPRFGVMGVAYTFTITNVVQLLWDIGWSIYLLNKKELVVL
jgi:O-antigen/teichoic acid export membrane protein